MIGESVSWINNMIEETMKSRINTVTLFHLIGRFKRNKRKKGKRDEKDRIHPFDADTDAFSSGVRQRGRVGCGHPQYHHGSVR